MKILKRITALLITLGATSYALFAAAGQEQSSPALFGKSASAYVNVQDAPYSAARDGKTDATPALQTALDTVGAAGGGIVFVPTGKYLIKTHLKIPAGTSLVGVGRAPMTYAPQSPQSTLLAVEGRGDADGTPFITLVGPNSTIEGITVFYPEQAVSDHPAPYPWTVRGGGGDNIAIINVLLVNPYQAVDFGTNQSARHYVRGLYGQPLLKGIWVDQCYDIGRIQDVHFWPFWTTDKRVVDFTTTHATTFIFQRSDWEVVQDIFCWGYHAGAELSSSQHGALNGQMTDVDFDNVDIGMDVSATQPYAVHVSNLNIANAGGGSEHVGIWGRKSSTSAELSVRGASFWGTIQQILRWQNSGSVSLSDSRLLPWGSHGPLVEILAGSALIHDNLFQPSDGRFVDDYSPQEPAPAAKGIIAVHVGPAAGGVLIHGNQFRGHGIVNEAGQRVIATDNQP